MNDQDSFSISVQQQNLQDKVSFLQKMVDLNPNLLFVIDLRSEKIIYINNRVKDLLGLNSDFVVNQGTEIFKKVLHPEDYQLRMNNLKICIQQQEGEECEVEVRFRTGSKKWEWFKIREKIFDRDSHGKVTHVVGTAHNIHSQKLWEERQKEVHQRFTDAQEIFHIGSFERKLPGDLVYYSPEFYRILGLEPKEEEISVEEFMSHVHPDDREDYSKAIQHTHATSQPLEILTRAIRPDGSIRYIHRRAAIIKNEQGEPLKVYGTAQDITERVRAEAERKKLTNLMRSTELVAHTGSYEIHFQSGKMYFSDGLFRLFGYEPGEFEPTLEWINHHSHQDDGPLVQQILEEAAKNKKEYSYTRRIYRKDGEMRLLEAKGDVLLDDQGNAVKFLGLVRDVTKSKRAQEELRKSEERSRNLLKVLQNAPDAYLVLSRTLTIELASDAYLEATNTRRQDIIGKHLFEAFPNNPAIHNATGVKNLNASLQTVLSTRKAHRMPIQYYDVKDHDGVFVEKYWSPTNTPVLNSEGEVDYIIHRVLDISEIMKGRAAVTGLVNETEILKTSFEEIKLQAAEIQENTALLQSIFDASPNSIVLYNILRDRDGKVEDFELAMLNAFNIRSLGIPEDFIGKRLTQAFPAVKENGVLEHFKHTAETGIPADFQQKYEGEGLNHFFHFRATKLGDQLLVTSEDITERMKFQETIQQMLNGSISAISIFQSVRDEEGKIIDFEYKGANKAAEIINNRSLDQIVGRRLLEFFPGARERILTEYARVVETGEPLRTRRHYTHEGFNNWFDVSAVKNGDGLILTFLDITEQKKGEQEVLNLKEQLAKKATDKYRKIINSLDEGYCLLEIIYDENKKSVDYRYLETNPVFEAQSGISNVLGKTVKELVPNIEPFWIEMYGRVARTGASMRFDDYSESLERWFDVYAFKIDDQDDRHVAVIFKDVTERKEAEERQAFLLNLTTVLRPLQDPDAIQLAAMEVLGKHLEVNRAFYSEPSTDENTLQSNPGYRNNIDEAPGTVKLSDYNPELVNRFLKGETLVVNDIFDTDILKEGHEVSKLDPGIRAGIAVPLIKNEKLVAAIRVQQVNPRRWTKAEVSLVEEVCEYTWAAVEKARAEEGLRESEQRFRDLVESSAIAVWETTPEGLVSQDSPSWRAYTGQSFEEWVGYGWLNAVHPEDRDLTFQKWKRGVELRQKMDLEYRMIRANGEYRWTNVKATPILDLEGRLKKWSGMNLDIHDRKMTEQALLKAKNEAEAASKAKEDFVSTMSHEIRTPLNAVIGLTNLLLENKPREDQKENLDSLSFSAQNLLSLINDILDFSKLEAGKGEVAQNDFSLSHLILSLQQLYRPQAKNNGTALKVHIDENVPAYIVTDQLKLSQILHNLVSNAVKFTQNGTINFTVSLGKKDKYQTWLDFSIEDTGIGVPREKLLYIFEKFSQAESSTVRQYGGTGLGLTITKLLLELLGSEIHVESELGKGSKFYFSLPVKEAENSPGDKEKEFEEDKIEYLNHINLLLVEDVEINRHILIQFFKNWWNLRPDEAVNGKEAVEMAQEKAYDLILMDVRMPIMDGYEAMKRIREINGYEKTPILALTADKNQKDGQFEDLITKPFNPVHLKRAILKHLAGKGQKIKIKGLPVETPLHSSFAASQAAEGERQESSFEITKYESLSGGNPEVFYRLLQNSKKAIATYKDDFQIAAEEENIEAISDLIHKNTISIHYIQANKLARIILEYREILREQKASAENLEEKLEEIFSEFDFIINGLSRLIPQE